MPDIFTQPEKTDLKLTETPENTPEVIQDIAPPTTAAVTAPVVQTAPAPAQEATQAEAIPSLKGIPPTPLGLLSYFRMHPTGVKFANQEDDETIILFIRRHFITNIPWILLTVLFLLLPIIVTILFKVANYSLFAIPPRLLIILLAFYYLVILSYALMRFIIWFYHVGIVTQRRLLDLDVYNILNHHLAETEVADIVDVSYMQRGFFQSFFDFGNVPIQTTAIKANFEFEDSPHPAKVSDVITDLRPQREGGKE